MAYLKFGQPFVSGKLLKDLWPIARPAVFDMQAGYIRFKGK